MENESLSETRPIQPDSAAEESAAFLEETRQVNPAGDRDDLAQTQVTRPDTAQSQKPMTPPGIHDQSAEDEVPSGLEATIPPPPDRPPGAPPERRPQPGRSLPVRWIMLGGIVFLLLTGVVSAWGGYQSGIGQRKQAQAAQISGQVEEQYNLALQDIAAERYYLARQRLEYVIQTDPAYPGVTERLAEVLLELNTTATPTVAPTPTLTPTPDLRGVEELFAESQVYITNQEWTLAIDTLLALRKADTNFQPVWVDDMLYIAFRNRGVDKILRQGDLEGGIFDLKQSEQIGPLDADAAGYQTWARLYITGASFWELDWGQAVYYFAQVAPALPNLRDGSNMTATERYRQALIGYGDFLAENGQWCDAFEQFELALSFGPDPEVEEVLDTVVERCTGGDDDDDEQVTEEPAAPTATQPPASEEPTPTQEPEPTEPAATEEPTPTEPPQGEGTPYPE